MLSICGLPNAVYTMGGIKKRSYYHSLLSSTDAEAILQKKEQNFFLLRRNIYKDFIISYKCKRNLIKHIRLPQKTSNNILKRNPHLDSPESLLDYILTKANQILSYPVSIESKKKSTDNWQTWRLASITNCEVCEVKVGTNKKKRRQHLEKYHKITECDTCGLILFAFQDKNHKEECRPESIKIFDCKFCSFSTKLKSYLKKHEEDHMLKTFICQFCDKKFFTDDKKLKHETDKHSEIFPCLHCEKTFTTLNSRSKHVNLSHVMVDNKTMLQCTLCYTIYESQTELKKHMRNHKWNLKVGPFICPNCDKVFKTPKTLQQHKKKTRCLKVQNSALFIGM